MGSTNGVPFNVEGDSAISSKEGAVAQLAGNFVFAWQQQNNPGAPPGAETYDIRHSIMSPNGVALVANNAVPNLSPSDINPEVVAHSDGSYVVGFEEDWGFDRDIAAFRFDGNGTPLPFNIPFGRINDFNEQKDLAITGLANNRTVLVWSTNTPDVGNPNDYDTDVNNTFGLRAAIYDAGGGQVRDVELVNAIDMPATAGNGDQIEASVATLANGDFVVTWTDNSLSKNDTFGTAIFARVFDVNGIPRGPSFQVNTTTTGNQTDSDVAALSGGGFVVTWTDASGANTDIRTRAFTANGTATDTADQLANSSLTAGNQTDSQVIGGGTNNTFMVTWKDEASAPNGTPGSSVRFQLFQDGNTPNVEPIRQPTAQTPRDQTPVLEEEIRGTNFADRNLDGNVLDNIIHGLGGNDRIRGLQGNDEIHGDRGRDTLTGNEGRDVFVFDTRPNRTSNWDKITDFNRTRDDIWLESRYFGKLGGSVSASELRFGKEAQDSNDYLIYDRSTGKLYYDSDGDGARGQVLFAQLTNKASIRFNDFDII